LATLQPEIFEKSKFNDNSEDERLSQRCVSHLSASSGELTPSMFNFPTLQALDPSMLAGFESVTRKI